MIFLVVFREQRRLDETLDGLNRNYVRKTIRRDWGKLLVFCG